MPPILDKRFIIFLASLNRFKKEFTSATDVPLPLATRLRRDPFRMPGSLRSAGVIKAIGAEARKELMEIFEVPVHLFLFVKVRDAWGDDPERYRPWGLDFNA